MPAYFQQQYFLKIWPVPFGSKQACLFLQNMAARL